MSTKPDEIRKVRTCRNEEEQQEIDSVPIRSDTEIRIRKGDQPIRSDAESGYGCLIEAQEASGTQDRGRTGDRPIRSDAEIRIFENIEYPDFRVLALTFRISSIAGYLASYLAIAS